MCGFQSNAGLVVGGEIIEKGGQGGEVPEQASALPSPLPPLVFPSPIQGTSDSSQDLLLAPDLWIGDSGP